MKSENIDVTRHYLFEEKAQKGLYNFRLYQTRIDNSAVGLKSCALTAGIKKYNSIIKKKKKKHDKRVLLAKTRPNSI